MNYLLKAYFNATSQMDVFNLTHDVKRALMESQILHGILTVFVPGSTAAVTCLENDPQIHQEVKNILNSMVQESKAPTPVRKSGSGSIEAHVKAAMLHPFVSIPVQDGKLLLGAWQEVILFDFDNKLARREVLIHLYGEGAPQKK